MLSINVDSCPDKLVVIERVSAGVCHRCGEKVVNAEVGGHIADILKDSNRINKALTISVSFVENGVAIAAV